MNTNGLRGASDMASRVLHIDLLRSVAILFMVEVHAAATLSPAGISPTDPLAVLAASIGGLAAPLFIAISGWGSQRSLSRKLELNASNQSLLAWAGVRLGFLMLCQLAVNLIADHVFMWYTPGVLSLLALCALLAWPLAKLRLNARIALFVALALSPFALDAVFDIDGSWMAVITAADWVEWLRLLLIEGTYPLLPWLAFFVLGGIIHDADSKSLRSMLSFTFSISAGALIAAMITNRAWALTSGEALLTFFPASPAFIFSATCGVLAGVVGLEWVENNGFAGQRSESFSAAGRLSLTIYILHFVPLRIYAQADIDYISAAGALGIVLAYSIIWWPLAVMHQRHVPRLSLEELLRRVSRRVERDS